MSILFCNPPHDTLVIGVQNILSQIKILHFLFFTIEEEKLMKTLRWLFLVLCMSIGGVVFSADKWVNPAPYPVGMDTWFGSYYNKTAQHDYRLRVGGWGDWYYTLLRFDLSGLPQNATNAYIWRYTINEGTPTDINWYRIGAQWHSGTVTSSNFPYASLTSLFWTSAPTPGYWYITNITSEYNQWRAGTGNLNYGLFLAPVSNNNNYSSFYSSTQGGGIGPWLQVTYTPQADDNKIKLRWPLGTPYASRVVTQAFGVNWAGGSECPPGVIKKHSGTDFSAPIGTAVYAAEDGVIKHVDAHPPWAYHIVLEHNHPQGGKYTTVYWHVTPASGITAMNPPIFVPKGMQIATIANLATGSHFHFGVRVGTYNNPVSGIGALPQSTCTDPDGTTYPGFPENFIDPNNINNVLFQ